MQSFLYYIIHIYHTYRKFLEDLDFHYMAYIYDYFYNNKVPYEEQRSYIFNNTYFITKRSPQNDYLEYLYHANAKKNKIHLYTVSFIV